MRRRTSAIAVTGLALGTAFATSASAAPPAALTSYAAGSSAYAVLLDVDAINLSLLASQTVASVSNAPTAVAGGGALVVADQVLGGPDETCPFALPDPLDLFVTQIGCLTTVEEADADPQARSTSEEVVVEIGGSGLSNQILTPLREAVIDQLGTGVQGVITQLGLADLPALETALDNVLDTLTDPAGSTVRVTLAPTNAAASADETGVLARSAAAGLIIEVVPALFGTPPVGITSCTASQALLCAQIAGSVAQVRRDPTTGVATTDATAAQLVDFRVAPQLGQLLADNLSAAATALNGAVTQLADSSPLACGEAGPLADLICLDAAGTDVLDATEAAAFGFPFGDGTVGARASALRVELLRAVNGGIALALNEAVAAANATIDVPRSDPTPTTTTPDAPSLARTGGDADPMVPALLLGAAFAVATLVRRSRLAG
jgi:hypothetical protein